jgi:hypothetical protein
LDTTPFSVGDPLYLDDEGGFVGTRGDSAVPIGQVVKDHATLGCVMLRPPTVAPLQTIKRVTVASTAAPLTISFPFAVADFIAQVRTATGVVRATGNDTFTLVSGDVRVTYDGSPTIQATDVITIWAVA